MLTFTNCRACKKQIYWCVYLKTGNKAPIETEPRDNGNLIVESNGTYRFATKEEKQDPGILRYVPHHAYCPAAQQFRNKGRKTNVDA